MFSFRANSPLSPSSSKAVTPLSAHRQHLKTSSFEIPSQVAENEKPAKLLRRRASTSSRFSSPLVALGRRRTRASSSVSSVDAAPSALPPVCALSRTVEMRTKNGQEKVELFFGTESLVVVVSGERVALSYDDVKAWSFTDDFFRVEHKNNTVLVLSRVKATPAFAASILETRVNELADARARRRRSSARPPTFKASKKFFL